MEQEIIGLGWKLAGLYLLIGLAMSVVAGCWRPVEGSRTPAVRWLQIFFMTVLWLPGIIWKLIRGEERAGA